jgi:orotidine-5'-phosphate decarboxylase
MTTPFADRLAAAVESKQSALVVGLDPQLEKLPAEIRSGIDPAGDARTQAAQAIRRFDAAVIELVAPYAVAVKPQVAFYEQWGPEGLAAYEHAIGAAHAAGLLVIGDVKRGDIGSTAAAYARAHLGWPRGGAPRAATTADAITVNPLLGKDSLAPFLDAVAQDGAGLFVLVRTSNPSARDVQDLTVDGRPLHERLAALVVEWGSGARGRSGYSSVGAVAGATAPRELQRLRDAMPGTWFLVPGVGAQGATARDTAPAFDRKGLGALVNSSRGILYAFGEPAAPNWKSAVRDAARQLRDELHDAAHQTAR